VNNVQFRMPIHITNQSLNFKKENKVKEMQRSVWVSHNIQ